MSLHPDVDAVLNGSAKWALVEGDCVEVLAELPPKSVDHVITDPPYSEHVHSKAWAGKRKTPLRDGNGRVTRCAFARQTEIGFEHLDGGVRRGAAEHCERVAKRWSLIFSDIETSHLWFADLTTVGLEFVRTALWVKLNSTPQFTGDRPGIGAEAICIVHPKGRKRWSGGGQAGVFTHPVERTQYSLSDLRINTTQKPLSLMLELVELFTDPGDIILDAFAGGATTGVAALRLGRRFIGVEKRPAMAAAARERLTAEEQGHSLRDARAGQLPMFGGLK